MTSDRPLLSRCLPLLLAACLSVSGELQAQPAPQDRDATKVGGVELSIVLERLGATMEKGVGLRELEGYERHFALVDRDGDGRHSKVEYIDKGRYMTERARRGIFNAADNDGDGFVTKAEYVLNRIVTDEAKALIGAMDRDRDGAVQRAEFVATALEDRALGKEVFAALDTDGNGEILVPEYLRVWGRWARYGQPSPERRLAASRRALGRPERPADTTPGADGAPASLAELLLTWDLDGDGKLEAEELRELIRRGDRNGDGALDRAELEGMAPPTRRPPGRGPEEPPATPRGQGRKRDFHSLSPAAGSVN